MVGSSKVEIVIQESKLGHLDCVLLQDVCPFNFVDGVCLPLSSAFGGIWLIWDEGKIEVLDS